MYKCPRADCPNDWGNPSSAFFRDVPAVSVQTINQDGDVISQRFEETGREDWHHVKCNGCGARAEWIDARQVELFPATPTLETAM